ncbi:hypothetical protein A2773_05885 [Candidatus Gottesmanbacteria bacterium RIFCSPHIGHO2_01_FULL_39_10]|uniref:Uncharacterized protein n=1 Tax=Candidatus Gottesmanbacteria bacterium RIFCSPHIGHO2_01_FULL_39_10 TaxID=1798375 RepID=A0A1F5ZLD0_9BACT|nr:MAG: hypothetical protein A2773_05885 [Candidatus Gottesmanbacteria bacterium RIFCSPHIGHO2_01_FULL_39_10]
MAVNAEFALIRNLVANQFAPDDCPITQRTLITTQNPVISIGPNIRGRVKIECSGTNLPVCQFACVLCFHATIES